MSSMQPDQSYSPQDQSAGPPAPDQGSTMFQPSTAQYSMSPQPVVDPSQQAAYQMMSSPVPTTSSKLPKIILGVLGLVVLLLLGFGVWAFGERQDYKNNSDQKATAAAEAASKAEGERKDAEFLEKEKQPYKTYTTPDASGSIKITYPKTWSAYIIEQDNSDPIDGYWHPNVVPNVRSETAFALRLEVVNDSYADAIRGYSAFVKRGTVKISPYTPKNVSGVAGSRVEGEIARGKQGVMIVLPLRDKTIQISTQSTEFIKDLDSIVLENLTFTP